MKNQFSYLLMIIILWGCASATSKKILGPDGTENVLIKGIDIEICYAKAREVCNGTYKIINSNSDTDQYGTEFNLLVKCAK